MHVDPGKLPAALRANALRLRSGRAWLAGLDALVQGHLERWSLRFDPAAGVDWWSGHAGIVVPVTGSGGRALALKVSIPEDELRAEQWALRIWAGEGAVRLVDGDGEHALLLERLDPARHLGLPPVEEACGVWGALVRRLSLPARADWPEFPRTDALAEAWNDELPARWSALDAPFPRALLEAALETCQLRGALSRREDRDFLLHGDLHYFNVLARPGATADDGTTKPGRTTAHNAAVAAGGWGPYVAIDPQGFVGDREFAVLPMLHNRLAELPARNQPDALRERLGRLCVAAGLDAGLATGWAVARAVQDVLDFREHGRVADAERSLWVATALAGLDMAGLPRAAELKPLV